MAGGLTSDLPRDLAAGGSPSKNAFTGAPESVVKLTISGGGPLTEERQGACSHAHRQSDGRQLVFSNFSFPAHIVQPPTMLVNGILKHRYLYDQLKFAT